MSNKRKCFVLMPFADKFTEVYQQVYKPVCERNEVDCWRVDEISRPGSITRDIIDGILDADVIIADLTTRNANVFYELGIAHSVGNKTIMTSQSIEDVPFDIANYRVILYEQSITGSKKLEIALEQALRELIASLDQTNNPVQEVFARRSVGGIRRRMPIVQAISVNSLHKSLREMIEQEGIRYIDELRGIDLESIRQKYGLGASNLSTLVRLILEYDAYTNLDELQKFILKYRLDTADRQNKYY